MKLQNLVFKLEKHHKKKIDLTLGRTYSLLKKLGNPQDKLQNIVNVVGTNSKASMAYSLKSILNQAGYKCNLYTSPHLQSYTERYVFNDQEISEDDLIDLLNDVEKILGDDEATVFEILTCAFYKYAENFRDNINIIESGLFYKTDPSSVFKANSCTLL
jgi:dihydrofolate synthase/folylpolyglutamate synthase